VGFFCGREFLSYVLRHHHFHRACLFPPPVFIHTFLISKNTTQLNIMPFEAINMEEITKARRKAIAESIRTVSVEELKALGERLFPFVDDPWREKFFDFITENSSTFHHATAHDGVQIIYCPAKDKGMWFMPGVGMGPMQPKGRAILKQIVEGR
jgi:hypothetical protein